LVSYGDGSPDSGQRWKYLVPSVVVGVVSFWACGFDIWTSPSALFACWNLWMSYLYFLCKQQWHVERF
jgi:hypothetical protein